MHSASEGAENADENANVESESIDNVRVHKKSKHLDEPHQQVTIDVEDEKDTFVQQSTQLKHDALDIKEQTEATLDKLNEVHYELVKNTNALLSAVDPNLNATINETEERIKAVEELAANADNAAQAVAAEAQPVMAVAVVEAETTTGVVAEAPQESKNEAAPIEPTTTNE